METIFINKKNSKTNELNKLAINLLNITNLQRLDFTSFNKHVAFQNLFIYYAWENGKQQYRNRKLEKTNLNCLAFWLSVRYSRLCQVYPNKIFCVILYHKLVHSKLMDNHALKKINYVYQLNVEQINWVFSLVFFNLQHWFWWYYYYIYVSNWWTVTNRTRN